MATFTIFFEMAIYDFYLDTLGVIKDHTSSACDPTQTPKNAASEQGLHRMLTGNSIQNTIKEKILTRNL